MLKGKSDKLEAKTEVCLFVGYPKGTRGGFFYIQKDKVFVSTNARYLEEDYVENFKPRRKIVLEQMSDIVDQPFSTIRDDLVVLDTSQDTINCEAIPETPESDPKTYKEAINDTDANH